MPEILLILFMLGWSSRHRDLVLRRGFAWDTAQGLGGEGDRLDPGPLGVDSTWTNPPPPPRALALAALSRDLIFKTSIGAVVLAEPLWQEESGFCLESAQLRP